MKCPFRKQVYMSGGRNTGCGYPDSWIQHVEFEECIKEECAIYDSEKEKCSFCNTYNQRDYNLLKEFEQKLP